MDSKEKIKEPEYEILNISSIQDLAKYKELTEDSEFDSSNVRFKINKQLIKERVYEEITNKERIYDLLKNSQVNIILELRRFYELYNDYTSIEDDGELKTFEELETLDERDIVKREPLEKTPDVQDVDIINIFMNFILAENEKIHTIEDDLYDE